MGMPSINIQFKTLGTTAIKRSQKGTLAVILKDTAGIGEYSIASITEIPKELGAENKAYLERAFIGYQNPPRKLLISVIDGAEKTLTYALAYFATQTFDYLVGPLDAEEADTQKIAAWVKSERQNKHMVKAVLPETAADSEGVVNFTTTGIVSGSSTYTPAQFCSRIAGIIAGTPMTISCTYAPLPELVGVNQLIDTEMDAAVDSGEFILFHDGEKVKTGRAVNSLTTVTGDKGESFKKIKVVETVDMIQNDIRITAQDNYIGKYPNSYDNKLLLVTSIKGYFEELERLGILEKGGSEVGIDVDAQEAYLKSTGVDTTSMSEQEIKAANTGSKVFLKASIQILDAIEDIDLNIVI